MTSKTSFWEFIRNNNIEIPIIQRDYAQGRLGRENLRKNFLCDLKKALDNEPPYKDAEMKLDFVYGSTENGRLNPLDGQQRLTTLWLLHWYIALRAGELTDDNCAIFRNFSYETRISSREFCQHLCIPHNFEDFDGCNIVGFITKQTWFYSVWQQDPTIQSMLRMLGGTKITNKQNEDIIDGVEEVFNSISDCSKEDDNSLSQVTFGDYWKKLTDGDLCPIVFYNLPLRDFGLSDDLYIKMNARGKQLTSFENFKADLIGYITTQADEESVRNNQPNEWNRLLDIREGLPIKFDNDWTDIFWENKSKGIKNKDGKMIKSKQIDEIFFAFMNRIFWNELFIAKEPDNPSSYILDIGKGDEGSTQESKNASYRYLNDSGNRNPSDYDTKIAYHGLDEYKYANGIPLGFFVKLQRVLNNYYRYSKTQTLPTCSWDAGFRFIPQYVEDECSNNIEITNNANDKILRVTTLNQTQRIVFFAICKYFDHDETVLDTETSLKQWMRVVWNLVSGLGEDGRPQIRSVMAMRTAIEHIDQLDTHDPYRSLGEMPCDEGASDFSSRWNEEIHKARQIVSGEVRADGKKWEEVIIDAEQYAFFRGSIRFLFQDENGQLDWSLFDLKFEHAKQYFLEVTPPKASAMQEPYHNADLLKKMMSWFTADTFWNVLWYKHRTFNNKPETWMYYLLNTNNYMAVHHLMLGERNSSNAEDVHSNDIVRRTLYILANSSLLEFVRTNIPNSWIRDYHNHKAIFPSAKGVFLDAEVRDSVLASTNNVEIRGEHIIPDTMLLYGSDINFTFNDYNFQWYRNDNLYLMEKERYWEYMVKDEKAQKDINKYYCISAKDRVKDANDLIQMLNELIGDVKQHAL